MKFIAFDCAFHASNKHGRAILGINNLHMGDVDGGACLLARCQEWYELSGVVKTPVTVG